MDMEKELNKNNDNSEISVDEVMSDFDTASAYLADAGENKKEIKSENPFIPAGNLDEEIPAVPAEEKNEEASENIPGAEIQSEEPKSEEVKEEAPEIVSEDKAEEEAAQTEAKEDSSSADAKSDFMSEFAPSPITIPNYNKEKAQKKAVKAGQKPKKTSNAKKKNDREKLRKAIIIARNIGVFILLASMISIMLFSIVVKMNTTQHAIEKAIRENNSEAFVIGKIQSPDELNLKKSSPRASLADIIRDNSDITITYADISREVGRSNYPHFLAKVSHGIIENYIFGREYKGITEKDIEELILSGSKRIYTLTGKNVGESASQSFAKYISGSEFFRDISKANVASQAINHETEITSILFSTGALIFVSVIAVLLIVLVIFTCKGFSHKMVGWSVIFGGVFTGVMGMLTSPFFAPESDLMKDVLAFLMNEFRNISFMWGVAGVVAGIIVITIGKFLSEDGYYYEEPEDEEEGYIEEIEQGVSAE